MRGGGDGRGLTVCNKALQDEKGRGGEGTDGMQQALQDEKGRGGEGTDSMQQGTTGLSVDYCNTM